jgi:hypothetical protein
MGFSALSFFFYGFNCLFSPFLKEEFRRFGLAKFRKLTGYLQLAGATGLTIGFYYHEVALVSSLGLGMLMILGVITRVRIKDSLKATFPAFIFAVINLLNAYWLSGFLLSN